jgi:hypothetical protein
VLCWRGGRAVTVGAFLVEVAALAARLPDRAHAVNLCTDRYRALLGFAAALSPPHTSFDGDTLFGLSVGDVPMDVTRLGLGAAEAVARAIVRAVRAAAERSRELGEELGKD